MPSGTSTLRFPQTSRYFGTRLRGAESDGLVLARRDLFRRERLAQPVPQGCSQLWQVNGVDHRHPIAPELERPPQQHYPAVSERVRPPWKKTGGKPRQPTRK